MEKAIKQRSFTQILEELNQCQWYWGAITPSTATRLLKERPAGTFLVRDSRSEKSIFSFSFTTENGIYHTRINYFNSKFCLGGPRSLIRSESLAEFVQLIIRSCSPATTDERQTSRAEEPGTSENTTQQARQQEDEGKRPLRVLMHPSMFIMNPAAEAIDIRYPLCRNQFVPTLKGACRLAIRHSLTDLSHIDSLPVPKRLKKYLAASDYLLSF